MGNPSAIEELLAGRYLRRGDEGGTGPWPALPSGFPELDALLSGGWPRGALIELMPDSNGIGELRLLLPVLVRLAASPHPARPWVVLVAPPCIPYAPALARQGLDLSRLLVVQAASAVDVLWAAEQALRSGLCAALLAWCESAQPVALKRLALAAAEDGALAILFRPPAARRRPSPAALRTQLRPAAGNGLALEIFRNRCGRVPLALVIALPDS
jgi:protein ImuA